MAEENDTLDELIQELTPDEAREIWDNNSRKLARSCFTQLQALIDNSASYELRKRAYDHSMESFFIAALDLNNASEIPPGMTYEKVAAMNIPAERWGKAVRRQLEEASYASPLHMLMGFARLMEVREEIFIMMERFSAEKYAASKEAAANAATAEEIRKALEIVFPVHPTVQ